jgi:hypothetical protein
MSSFTRLTRKCGIIHYASLISRMRELLVPLFYQYGAESVFTEADNLFVLFPSPPLAMSAVFHARALLSHVNDAWLGDPDFHIRVNGFGMAFHSKTRVHRNYASKPRQSKFLTRDRLHGKPCT